MRRTCRRVIASNQTLGGEDHETCFCICWPRRAWRRCTVKRCRIRDACRRSGPGFPGSEGRLRLQRMGPLLAPALLRLRYLSSALLGRMAPSLGLWLASSLLAPGLAPALLGWLGLASLAPLASLAHLEHWCLTGAENEKGASRPFLFCRRSGNFSAPNRLPEKAGHNTGGYPC